MRRASWRAFFASLLCLPLAGSALIVLSVPPVSAVVPAVVRAVLRPAVDALFDAMARVPPGSLAGRVFFGSYDALVPIFHANALAVHAALFALPPAALAAWVVARPKRCGRASTGRFIHARPRAARPMLVAGEVDRGKKNRVATASRR